MRRRTIYNLTKQLHLTPEALNDLFEAMKGIDDSTIKSGRENYEIWTASLNHVQQKFRSQQRLTNLNFWSKLK